MKREDNGLKFTPLHKTHKDLHARMVSFAGWEMPIQYTGVREEHLTVRKTCGLFDVSHMGEIEVEGVKATETVQALTTNDASRLRDGQAQYTLLCRPDGGIVDDVLLYKFTEAKYMFCVNAANTDKDFIWIKKNIGDTAAVRNLSSRFGQLAIQGHLSKKILQNTCNLDLSLIRYYHFREGKVADADVLISRTGYTGEDGFEIYTPWDKTVTVWKRLMEEGRGFGIKPVGLGARDTLRLEMGFPLYGSELNERTTPLEANLHRFVALHKPYFIGKEALERQAAAGINKSLVGLEMTAPGIPRSHYKILSAGRVVGEVTSGTMSPSLSRAIGMGYVETALASAGRELEVEIRNKAIPARIIQIPFYRRRLVETAAS